MSMLAGPRIKQKFSSDPRGTAWSNDDSKFGQKLMEKFGWKKGKGLGANEDGNVNHVTVALKTDNRGVGCSKSHADNWIAHQDDFNSLLASLNQANDAVDDPDSKKVIGLEAKSKSSRSRVHYQKFTKGKDLSGKSSEDLDCIFGKRKLHSETSTPQLSDENSCEDAEDRSHGVVTVRSTESVQDYFAKKMSEIKKSKGDVDLNLNHVTTTNSGFPDQLEIKEDLRDLETELVVEFSVVGSVEEEGISESEAMESKDLVKQKKHVSGESLPKELNKKVRFMLDAERENSADEMKEKKKNKKRKKSKDNNCDIEIDSPDEVVDGSKVKKKKSKKRKESQEMDKVKTQCLEENVGIKIEVKKKKRKREEISGTESGNKKDLVVSDENKEDCSTDFACPEIQKKQKISTTSQAEETVQKVNTNKSFKKKKKKKSKNKNIEKVMTPNRLDNKRQESLTKGNQTKTKKEKKTKEEMVPYIPPSIKTSCTAFKGSNLTNVSGYAYSPKIMHKAVQKQLGTAKNFAANNKNYQQKRRPRQK